MESKTLYYRKGTSDKVYRVELIRSGYHTIGNNDYLVNYSFGRRGTTMQHGTKTLFPVSYTRAKQIFDRLVMKKKGEGYRERITPSTAVIRNVAAVVSGYNWTCPNCGQNHHEARQPMRVWCSNCEIYLNVNCIMNTSF